MSIEDDRCQLRLAGVVARTFTAIVQSRVLLRRDPARADQVLAETQARIEAWLREAGVVVGVPYDLVARDQRLETRDVREVSGD